jgi:hypothetical protein
MRSLAAALTQTGVKSCRCGLRTSRRRARWRREVAQLRAVIGPGASASTARLHHHETMTRRAAPAPNLAWPLSASAVTSFLAEGLGPRADEVRVTYVSWERRPSDTPLTVTWTPPERGSIGSSFGEPGANVWIAPVAKADLARTRAWLSSAVLPDLASWLRMALDAPPTWQGTHHERGWRAAEGDAAEPIDREGFHR